MTLIDNNIHTYNDIDNNVDNPKAEPTTTQPLITTLLYYTTDFYAVYCNVSILI